MSRYIDADALKKAIAESEYTKETIDGIDLIEVLVLKDIIDKAPTVLDTLANELAEGMVADLEHSFNCGYQEGLNNRPKGKWEFVQYDANPNIGNWHCTNCRRIAIAQYNFCPTCGANMRSVDEDLCETCKHADTCDRSDKGVSFAKHSVCWKYER